MGLNKIVQRNCCYLVLLNCNQGHNQPPRVFYTVAHKQPQGVCVFWVFPSRVIIFQRRMLIRQISILLCSMRVIWTLLIRPLLHARWDNTHTLCAHPPSHFTPSPQCSALLLCCSATCGASSPLVMILAIRLHFLLLVALWIIFFLSSSPTDTYWKP